MNLDDWKSNRGERRHARKKKPKLVKALSKVKRVLKRDQPRLTDTVSFDGTPVFAGLALMLEDARKHGWNGGLNSADRREGVAERFGKMSQAALWLGFIAGKAGFNPANPPGRSTHELRSDGVPYRGPIGRPLTWWQLGLDVSDSVTLVNVLNRLGYSAFRPYSSPSEAHHVNLRKSPSRALKRRGRA